MFLLINYSMSVCIYWPRPLQGDFQSPAEISFMCICDGLLSLLLQQLWFMLIGFYKASHFYLEWTDA